MRAEEPTGPQLAQTLRALLPESRQASFDEMAELYAPDGADISQCGALMSLTGPFNQCLAAREMHAVGAVLNLMDELLADFPSGLGIYNSVLTCFFESILPVPAEVHQQVMLMLGPRIRAYAKRYEPSWLAPEPPVQYAMPSPDWSKDLSADVDGIRRAAKAYFESSGPTDEGEP
jgi:hypothetical protein